MKKMWIYMTRIICAAALLIIAAVAVQPAWATLPTPNQPILVVQDSSSADPNQNFVPELLTTEGLNGFQVAQLGDLTSGFLANYDVVILPHLTLTSGQATLFQTYVNNGGTLVGFRPDLQLANVFGVASLGTTLQEAWLKMDITTPYAPSLDNEAMRFHGPADLYSLSGASALATLYNTGTSPTTSPAAAIYNFGLGKAILFSFDLTQSVVLMRQGNPAWAGYPNNHDGYNTMRPTQMFMDHGSGQFWNDLGDGALNDVPQADIQMRLFSNLVTLTNAAKRPLPKLWYFPNQKRAMLLMTADDHSFPVSDALTEISNVTSYGSLFTYNLWYPFTTISNTQVNTWLAAGYSMAVHFNDIAEVDSSGVGGSAASWNGMQSVMSSALTSFAATYPSAPYPVTTRNHFIVWVSNDANGTPDQVAQAKLFQNNGIELDTSFSSFPKRWGYMTGSGLPMKFLDPVAGSVIPVYEQATQYEDDDQIISTPYGMNWSVSSAQGHYVQSLSDSLNKYNTVITMLFHPEYWPNDQSSANAALQYAQSQSIPMFTTGNWLAFWQARAATTVSMPSFTSGTLNFTTTGSPAGLTLLVPFASGNNQVVSTLKVDAVSQSFTVAAYQGVTYASVVLTTGGSHNISVSYTTAGRILGQISPSAAATSSTIQVQGGSITETVPVAADGTYVAGPLPAATYTVTPEASSYTFLPTSRSVTLGTTDVTNVNFSTTFFGETLFTTQTPAVTNNSGGPGENYELGTSFTSDVAGQITGVRFWKSSSETGTHTGKIWDSNGNLLASVTFTNETASGWQRQALSTPLSVAANTKYVVSVNTGNTFYSATSGGLASQVVNGDLSSVVGNNGLYGSTGQFPTSTFNNVNYFRDIYFIPSGTSTLVSLTLNLAELTGGSSSTGTVTLSNPAPQGGAVVTLSSGNSAATVPSSVTVATGATTATFTVNTSVVGIQTTVNILGSYNGFQTAALTIDIQPVLTSVSVNPTSVTGGSTSTGSVTLSFAPPNDQVVALAATNPLAQPHLIQSVNNLGALQADASIIWANLGPPYFNSVPSGSVATASGVTGLTATLTNSANLPLQYEIECPGDNCGLVGNFNPGADVLWDSGHYLTDGTWVGNGPMTIAFNSPQRGLGLQVIADETGPFTATMCAYDSSNTRLGCAPFAGNSSDAKALFIGIYDDTQEISSVTIDAGGALYPHDFAIGDAFVVNGEKQLATVPATVTVAAGTTSATFPVTTNQVSTSTSLTISGNYNAIQTATLTLTPPDLILLTMNPNGVPGGTSSTGTVTLANPAPSGGAVVVLTNDVPVAEPHTIQAVSAPGALQANNSVSPAALQADGSLSWSTLGAPFTTIPSGTLLPVSGVPGLNVTLTNSANQPLTYVTECPADNCGIVGNFNPGADVLWDGGRYVNGTWVGNGPLTIALSSPIRGLGFQIMPDEGGPFTATMCAHDSSNTKLGCASFSGTGAQVNQAILVGIYDDTQEISKITVDGGGALYPHDFAIGDMFVTSAARPVVAVVPSSVTVLAGQTTGTFTVTTNAVNTSTFVNITGSYSGTQTTGTVQVTAITPGISTVSFSPVSVAGGSSSTGTVTLSSPAVVGGAVVALSSDNAAATVPASVTVAAHATTANFTVTTSAVTSVTTSNITATLNGTPVTAQLTAVPAATAVASVSLSPTSIVGGISGQTSTGTVTLNRPAPSGGMVVTLTSDTPSVATVPASVTVPAFATSTTFTVTPLAVGTSTGVSISANVGATAAQSATLTVVPPSVLSVSMSPTSVEGGLANSTGTVTLNDPAAGTAAQRTVALSNTSLSDSIPASVIVTTGATTATFTATTSKVSTVAMDTITATLNGSANTTLTINPPQISSVALNPTSVTSAPSGTASTSTGTVTLNATAPTSGVVVTLASTNTSAATVPGSVTVPSGSSSTTFTVTSINGLTATATSSISATLTGGGSQSATLTVVPPAIGVASLTLNPTSVQGGSANSTATVTLNGPAPTGGASVTLGSNSASAIVSGTVTVAANATSATFLVTSVKVGTQTLATISATYKSVQQTAVLTVNPPQISSVALSPTSLIGGVTSTATVTLNATAPASGVVVNVASSNTAVATLSVSSVTVPSGSSSTTFTVTSIPIATTSTSSISATLTGGGTQSATLTVNPPTLSSLTLNPTTVTHPASSTGTVRISGAAPTGGFVVNLASSKTSVGTVLATMTIAAGQTSGTFTVTTLAAAPGNGRITITASKTGSSPQTASLSVN